MRHLTVGFSLSLTVDNPERVSGVNRRSERRTRMWRLITDSVVTCVGLNVFLPFALLKFKYRPSPPRIEFSKFPIVPDHKKIVPRWEKVAARVNTVQSYRTAGEVKPPSRQIPIT
jgi:hypothetical protein